MNEPLARYVERYLRWQRASGHSQKTIVGHRKHLSYFINFVQEDGPPPTLADLNAETVRDWVVHMRERGLSPFTILTRVRSVKAFSAWLAAEDYTDGDLLRRVRPPKAAQVPKTVLTPQQVDTILATCPRGTGTGLRDRAIILTLYSTGIRVGELLALKVADLQPEQGLIRIERGKGLRFRLVPLSQTLDKAISRYLAKRPHDHPTLFLTDEGRPFTYWGIKSLLYRKAKATGIRIHPHLFRHTFAVQYLRNGGKLEHLKAIMGHSTYEMTLWYAKVAGQDIADEHNRVDPARLLKER